METVCRWSKTPLVKADLYRRLRQSGLVINDLELLAANTKRALFQEKTISQICWSYSRMVVTRSRNHFFVRGICFCECVVSVFNVGVPELPTQTILLLISLKWLYVKYTRPLTSLLSSRHFLVKSVSPTNLYFLWYLVRNRLRSFVF